jgi:hypothetical protein
VEIRIISWGAVLKIVSDVPSRSAGSRDCAIKSSRRSKQLPYEEETVIAKEVSKNLDARVARGCRE